MVDYQTIIDTLKRRLSHTDNVNDVIQIVRDFLIDLNEEHTEFNNQDGPQVTYPILAEKHNNMLDHFDEWLNNRG